VIPNGFSGIPTSIEVYVLCTPVDAVGFRAVGPFLNDTRLRNEECRRLSGESLVAV
jgi:hypothetical protein